MSGYTINTFSALQMTNEHKTDMHATQKDLLIYWHICIEQRQKMSKRYFLIPNYQRKEMKDVKTLLYGTSFFTLQFAQTVKKNKYKTEECQGCPWLTHFKRKAEQKALWNGMVRQPHICIRWKKEHRLGGGTQKKQISKSPQHMETGSEEEEVLTGCPCGFWLIWVWGWRQRCVFVWKSYARLCSIRDSVGLQVRVRRGWQGLLRKGPLLQGWQTSSGLSVYWKMTAIWMESTQHNS